MNAKNLLAAVKDGTVKESTIDDKVLRLLRTALRYGFLDRPQFDPADSTYSVADRAWIRFNRVPLGEGVTGTRGA